MDNIKDIAKKNIYILYHIPKRYTAINELFEKYPNVKHTLLKIWNFVLNNGGIIEKDEMLFFITTQMLNVQRKRTTSEVSNRHLNYLSCCGFLNKSAQIMDYGSGTENLSSFNKEMILNNISFQPKPINTFIVKEYTSDLLLEINHNISKLQVNNIKPSNISNDLLLYRNLSDEAGHTYYNNVSALSDKLKNYAKLQKRMKKLINQKGYCTKEEILQLSRVKKADAQKTYKFFRSDILKDYAYKLPTKEQVALYGIEPNKYIFTKRKDK